MDHNQIQELDARHFLQVFGRRAFVHFTGGHDAVLHGDDGKEYQDFLAGIAVNALGYSDAGFQSAVKTQVDALIHISNYFYNEPQARLAQLLCEKTGLDRVFFGNSGAEANECALKIAKKYAFAKGKQSAKFVSVQNSFHGRTVATLFATGQDKFHTAFRPGAFTFDYIPANDVEAAKAAIDGDVCGVICEVIQGEGGVLPLTQEYLQTLRDLCTQQDVALIIDEIQTGMGRTGAFLAQQLYGVQADITTLAKALGNGIPIGACLATQQFADAFAPGDHGSTFGGNPLACAAGLYVTSKIDAAMLDHVRALGVYLKEQLCAVNSDQVCDVRGEGLMVGMQLKAGKDAHDVVSQMLRKGFVIGSAGGNTLRFVPPYVIAKEQIDALKDALESVL